MSFLYKSKQYFLQQGKDRSETNSNEQRLPLKKRHYHLTSASNQQLPECDTLISVKTVSTSEKPTNKEIISIQKKEVPEKNKTSEFQRILRSSIDEAIEATITRYRTESPALTSDLNSDSSSTKTDMVNNQRSVIVTPKKRHRMQDLIGKTFHLNNVAKANEFKAGLKSSDSKGSLQLPLGKSAVQTSCRSISSFKQSAINSGKGESFVNNQSLVKSGSATSRESNAKCVGALDFKRRSGSRCLNKDTKNEKPLHILSRSENEKVKNEDLSFKISEKVKKSTSKNIETKDVDEKFKTEGKIISNPERSCQPKFCEKTHNTRSCSKPESTQTEYLLTEKIENLTMGETEINNTSMEMKTEDTNKTCLKHPVAGIFEPSSLKVEIDTSILAPLTSPSEIPNLKTSSNLKICKDSKVFNPTSKCKNEKVIKHRESFQNKKYKKLKTLKSCKEVRVKIQKLTAGDILLTKAAAEVKKKARRRKTINRTGFPSNKKKKKRPAQKIEATNFDKTVPDNTVISDCIVKHFPNTEKHSARLASKRSTKLEESQEHMSNKKLKSVPMEETSAFDVIDHNIQSPLCNVQAEKEDFQNVGEKNKTEAEKPLNFCKRNENLKSTRRVKRVRRNSVNIVQDSTKKFKISTKGNENETKESKEKTEEKIRVEISKGVVISKRKRFSTLKSTSSQLKNRHQYPLLSMKKFKKVKEELRAPRYY